MRIINLIENTEGHEGCAYAHGLSFYVETSKHKLLLDLGPSEETLHNAEKLGIDLSEIDTVIISHGHYDHSGGIMPFAKVNSDVVIYMQETADADYYADDGEKAEDERYRYIGIDKEISALPQVVELHGDYRIDDELREIIDIGKELKKYPTKFFTCHCTGEPAYKIMKHSMGENSSNMFTQEKKWI